MQIIKDAAAHDALQQYLVRIIAEDVRDALQHAAASGASLEEAVQAITFGVTTIVDGTRPMRHADAPVVPVLTFGVLDEDENLTGVLSSGDTSFMHEYAVAVAKQVVHAEPPPASPAPVTHVDLHADLHDTPRHDGAGDAPGIEPGA